MKEQKKTRPTVAAVEREMVEAVGMGHSYFVYFIVPCRRPKSKGNGGEKVWKVAGTTSRRN